MAEASVTVAARKVGESWEAALIDGGKFMRAYTSSRGGNLSEIVGALLSGYLTMDRNQGTSVGISISVSEPDAE